jgi:hypothetical protein
VERDGARAVVVLAGRGRARALELAVPATHVDGALVKLGTGKGVVGGGGGARR